MNRRGFLSLFLGLPFAPAAVAIPHPPLVTILRLDPEPLRKMIDESRANCLSIAAAARLEDGVELGPWRDSINSECFVEVITDPAEAEGLFETQSSEHLAPIAALGPATSQSERPPAPGPSLISQPQISAQHSRHSGQPQSEASGEDFVGLSNRSFQSPLVSEAPMVTESPAGQKPVGDEGDAS